MGNDEIKGFVRVTYTYCYPHQALGGGGEPPVIYRDRIVYRDNHTYRSSSDDSGMGLGFFGGFMLGSML